MVRHQYHVDTFNIFGSIDPWILNKTPAALLPHKLFLGVLGFSVSSTRNRYSVLNQLNVIISVD